MTLGMQRWRTGMRLRNVRTPGEGGAGGRQNSVGESLLRGQSAAGPNARGARCPSAAAQSSVFNRHIALVDWAVGRNLQRSYCIDFGCAAIALSSALSALCVCGFDGALSITRPVRISQRHTHLATEYESKPAHPVGRPHFTDTTARPLTPHPRHRIHNFSGNSPEESQIGR